MKRWMFLAVFACSLVTVSGQSRDRIRDAFTRVYPPAGPSFAVVIRGDLPTVGVNGARGRERGKAKITLEVDDSGWKQAGSLGREPATGTLGRGEIVQVPKVDFDEKSIEIRLQSLEPHDIVKDPKDPSRNRSEPVATVLKVAHRGEVGELGRRINAYVRLFSRLEDARTYAASLGQPRNDRRFTLALVRRDGVMVPFASYDNGIWYNRWPQPSSEREVPIDLASVPEDWWGIEGPSTTWTAYTLDGQSRPLQVLAPLAFDAHCMMNVGLRTDFKPALPAPPLEQHHYPKDAVAINVPLRIEPVETLTADDQMWKNLEALLVNALQWEELQQLRGLPRTDPRFQWAESGVTAMEKVKPKLEVLCAALGSAPNTLDAYFEASKRYEPADKAGPNACGPVTFTSGFVHRNPAGQGALDKAVDTRLSDCTQWNVEFRRPLGLLRLGEASVWIMQVSRWGGESYELVENVKNQASVVLTANGGWCGKLGN